METTHFQILRMFSFLFNNFFIFLTFLLRGESPLDIAVKLNLKEIIDILSKTEWTIDKLKQAKKCSKISLNERISPFDRRTIFQQNNVPDQLINMIQMGRTKPTGIKTTDTSTIGSLPVCHSSPNLSPSSPTTSSNPPKWKQRIKSVKNTVHNKVITSHVDDNLQNTTLSDDQQSDNNNNQMDSFKKAEFKRASSSADLDTKKKIQAFSAAHRSKTPSTNSDQSLTVKKHISNDDSIIEYRYALWDTTADESDEISFQKGDRIRVISKASSGWWIGELDSGESGSFPYNYTASESAYNSKFQKNETNLDPTKKSNVNVQNRTTSPLHSNSVKNIGIARGDPSPVVKRELPKSPRGRGRPVSTRIHSGVVRALPQPK